MTDATPQFSTAEYQAQSGAEACKSCKQPLAGRYFRVNGAVACERCTEQLKAQLPKDSHSAFVRGLVFGIGGAILGLVLYSAFGIITGIVIGYASLAVGFLVGKAIRLGSGGIGGRRYQVAAVLLTYAAVSMSAIPLSISEGIKEKKIQPPGRASQPASAPALTASDVTAQSASTADTSATPSRTDAQPNKMSLGIAVLGLAILGLASPFLELGSPVSGIIGLVILFVGIRIAWQLTAGPKVEILGPFTAGATSPPPPAG